MDARQQERDNVESQLEARSQDKVAIDEQIDLVSKELIALRTQKEEFAASLSALTIERDQMLTTIATLLEESQASQAQHERITAQLQSSGQQLTEAIAERLVTESQLESVASELQDLKTQEVPCRKKSIGC